MDLIYGCCDRCIILTGIRVTVESQLMRVWLRWPARTDATVDSNFPTIQMYTSEQTNLVVTNCIRILIVRIVKSIGKCAMLTNSQIFYPLMQLPRLWITHGNKKNKTLPSRHQSMLQIWKRSFFCCMDALRNNEQASLAKAVPTRSQDDPGRSSDGVARPRSPRSLFGLPSFHWGPVFDTAAITKALPLHRSVLFLGQWQWRGARISRVLLIYL